MSREPAGVGDAGEGEKRISGCRPFRLGDAMVLVAAAAVGLAPFAPLAHRPNLWPVFQGVTLRQLVGIVPWQAQAPRLEVFGACLLISCWFLAIAVFAGTPAYLAVRFRRPRPPLRELWLQPGIVACEALLVGMVLTTLRDLYPWVPSWMVFSVNVVTIPAAWSILAVSGRWRPEPGWIERLGRLLGVCYMIVNALATILIHGVLDR